MFHKDLLSYIALLDTAKCSMTGAQSICDRFLPQVQMFSQQDKLCRRRWTKLLRLRYLFLLDIESNLMTQESLNMFQRNNQSIEWTTVSQLQTKRYLWHRDCRQ